MYACTMQAWTIKEFIQLKNSTLDMHAVANAACGHQNYIVHMLTSTVHIIISINSHACRACKAWTDGHIQHCSELACTSTCSNWTWIYGYTQKYGRHYQKHQTGERLRGFMIHKIGEISEKVAQEQECKLMWHTSKIKHTLNVDLRTRNCTGWLSK